jgi:putative ATPase
VLFRSEAMVDTETEDAFDTAATATSKATATSWSRRASSRHGDMLARIRDRLFENARLDRDALVLDLRAHTGLLALSAARIVKHGAVWALAHDERAYATLAGMAQSLDELERPQVLRTSWERFDTDLREAAGRGVLFTAILGRNVLGAQADKAALAERATALLAAHGALALAETIPSKGQRISELLDPSELPSKLSEALLTTEQALFAGDGDPRTNWDERTLRTALSKKLRGYDIQCSTATEHTLRRFTAADIEHWFRRTPPGERPSLGGHLAETLGPDEVTAIRECLMRGLVKREVQWRTVIAFVTVRRAASDRA